MSIQYIRQYIYASNDNGVKNNIQTAYVYNIDFCKNVTIVPRADQ